MTGAVSNLFPDPPLDPWCNLPGHLNSTERLWILNEAERLPLRLKDQKDHHYLEIGSWLGAGLGVLLYGTRSLSFARAALGKPPTEAERIRSLIVKIHSIDLYSQTFLNRQKEILGIYDIQVERLTRHNGRSQEIGPRWDTPLDFVFIDGSHETSDVIQDLENFSRWIVPGGTIALHDARIPEKRFVSDWINRYPNLLITAPKVHQAIEAWLKGSSLEWIEMPAPHSLRAFHRQESS